jgi:hypothetical protein
MSVVDRHRSNLCRSHEDYQAVRGCGAGDPVRVIKIIMEGESE